ncbi:MAG: hypothetical protein HYS09_02775 [Chloroflexi bacterium]|nr:hypothetical protein [Chloroflexota bacterium]
MALVQVKGLIGKSREELREVEFMVDTGSFYTILSTSLCAELGLSLPLREHVVTADSRTLEISLGPAHIEINDREAGILVGSLEVPAPLLGASALEALGLKVNPVEGTLEPTRPFPGIPAL